MAQGKNRILPLVSSHKVLVFPRFSQTKSQVFYLSHYTQLNQLKLLLLTPKTCSSLGENQAGEDWPLIDWDWLQFDAISIPIPPPCPAPPLLTHATVPSQRLVPAAALPKRAVQKTKYNGGGHLESAVQPFASFFIVLWFFGDVKSRLMGAGWESLSGWRADKREAGQSW